MLGEELREKLKSVESSVEAIKAFWHKTDAEQRLAVLSGEITQELFWQHPERDRIRAEHRQLKEIAEEYHTLMAAYKDSIELIELFSGDEHEMQQMSGEVLSLCARIDRFKIELLLQGDDDSLNCYLSINAGAGGTESQDWASILLRMYLRFCEREHFKVSVLDYQSGEEAGIKSATLYVKKKNAYGLLKAESGIHRLVRISPFDANKRRHTSFAAVTILPEVEDAKVEVLDKDLRIDTYRAGGAGGQHVNKTDSAVRITHVPTNTVVQCQSERSQTQNKQTAMKMLKAKLLELERSKQEEKQKSHEKKKIEWGSQIRSYVLHPYKMVKDHRTDHESPQADLVLDGEIMPFIESFLMQESTQGLVTKEHHDA